MTRRFFASLAFSFLLLGACAAQTTRTDTATIVVQAPGAVSAADPRAAEAGREMLRAGGSAADAAIATAIALTVVEPQSSGIGGGGFLVHHDGASRALTSFDGREEAPSAAGPDWFLDTNGKPIDNPSVGGRATGVPGNIRMFALAHSKHGKLPWARLFDPAIRLARDGYRLTERGHDAVATWRPEALKLTPWARATYLDANGAAKPVGTVIRNPELARTMTEIARRGPDSFYTGPLAERIVRAVSAAPRHRAPMTKGDLVSYDAKQRDPQCGAYRGHRICGMGPPSSGATTVFAILKQLERFDLAALGPDSPQAWHLIAESMRLAYADREAYLADPDHVGVPTAGLMNADYLSGRSALITSGRAMSSVAPGTPPGATKVAFVRHEEPAGTSHMVATDRWGNVATLTSTIEAPWGSGVTVDGMFLNNELTDFHVVPRAGGALVANRVEGGKRPRSSMSPTVVYGPDGQVRLALGAAGGATIIMQVAKSIIGVVDWGRSAQEAIALPTLTAAGPGIAVEQGTALEAMAPALTALGHRVTVRAPGFKANAIERVGGRWIGAADPRSEGVALSE
ncbi:MAG TPA: gamma-glutamyltransferase [Allosphingosinicella sp.]|jgi:gamma-glutamyltranspeptidase/glutathione hydrolase